MTRKWARHGGKIPGNKHFLNFIFIFYISISNVWGDTDSKILEFWIKFSKIGPCAW
jgi:hypothetical protein